LWITHVLERMESRSEVKIVGSEREPFGISKEHAAFGASGAREIRIEIHPDNALAMQTAPQENYFITTATTHDEPGESSQSVSILEQGVRAMDHHCGDLRYGAFRQSVYKRKL
jgi:hypothetical protein